MIKLSRLIEYNILIISSPNKTCPALLLVSCRCARRACWLRPLSRRLVCIWLITAKCTLLNV